jgi:hypothetical protein
VTPLSRPVTRLCGAWVRDRGLRQLVVTLHGTTLELRPKGLRCPETLDLAMLYSYAVKSRVMSERAARVNARRSRR